MIRNVKSLSLLFVDLSSSVQIRCEYVIYTEKKNLQKRQCEITNFQGFY